MMSRGRSGRMLMLGVCMIPLVGAGACLKAYAEGGTSGQTTLTIGRVSDNHKKHYKRIKPFIDYVASQLSGFGIRSGRVSLPGELPTLVEQMKRGEVDLVAESPFAALVLEEVTGAQILVRSWKRGSSQYHSLVFVRKDSGIETLEDLKGRRIAFEDPGSTTAYLIPRAVFRQRGIPMVKLQSFEDPVPPDAVGYLFAGGEVNISHWLFNRRVEAGVMSNEEFQESEEVPDGMLPHFKVIYESIDVPRNLIVARQGLDPKLVAAITTVLLDMKKTHEGRLAMKQFQSANFDRLPLGHEIALRDVRALYELVKDEVLPPPAGASGSGP